MCVCDTNVITFRIYSFAILLLLPPPLMLAFHISSSSFFSTQSKEMKIQLKGTSICWVIWVFVINFLAFFFISQMLIWRMTQQWMKNCCEDEEKKKEIEIVMEFREKNWKKKLKLHEKSEIREGISGLNCHLKKGTSRLL